MAKSNEPFWWGLFAAGGVITALFLPALIAVTSMGILLNWTTPDVLWQQMHNPGVRIFLFVVISLTLFHWAHRFRFTLVDLGLKALSPLIAVLCYGTAVAGTAVAIWLLVRY
jgi:fumarate reductase subunit D